MPKSYAIDVSEPDHFIRVRVFAPLTRGLAREVAMALKQLDEKIDGTGFLADVRGAPNIGGPANNYEFAYKDMAAMGLSRSKRAAILADPGESTHNFPETVIRNAGYNVRLFFDEAQAIDWLRTSQNGD